MIKVDVLRISYYPPNKGYAVMLKEVDGKRQVPILVGSNEAQSIAMSIEGIQMPRPMTHDLILNIIHSLDVNIKRIVISEIMNGTFFAKIQMNTLSSGDIIIDSRPSDAISIGLRSMAPIYVEESVFNEVSIIEDSKNENLIEDINQEIEVLANAEDMLENLNEALIRAIEEEEYEVAARLRDRIKELEKRIDD